MMKSSQACFDDIPVFVVRVASRLRERGVAVSPSDEVLAAELLANYVALSGDTRLNVDEAAYVLSSVLARRGGEEWVLEAVRHVCSEKGIESDVERSVARDMAVLGVGFGSPVARPIRRMARSEREALARLSLLGFVRRGRRGLYVVSEKKGRRLLEDLSRSYASYADALRYYIRRALNKGLFDTLRLMGDELLDYVKLDDLSIRELVSLHRIVKGRWARRAIAEHLVRKLRREGVGKPEARPAAEILLKHGLVDEASAGRLLAAEPRLAGMLAGKMGKEAVIDAASQLSPSAAALAASRALHVGVREREALELLARLGRLSGLGDLGSLGNLGAVAGLSRAFSSIVQYLVEGNDAYLDVAEYELSRVDGGELDEFLETFRHSLAVAVAAFRSGNVGEGLNHVVRFLEPGEALDILNAVASRPEYRRVALRLAYLVLRSAARGIGGRSGKKRYLSHGRGEVDLRESLYNIIRSRTPFVVTRARRRLYRIVLVLDKSASMRRHLFYAIVSAASLAHLVDRLVVFDEVPYVVPRSVVTNPYSLIEYVISLKFGGYTDIVAALYAATRGLPPRRLILISDLRQTVTRSETLVDALSSLLKSGWRIDILAPVEAGEEVSRNQLRELPRLRVHIVGSERDIGRMVALIARRSAL